jgi:hypothetical protein
MEERIGQRLPGPLALLLVRPSEMLAGDVNNTNQRLFGYVVTLHHETDHRFVHHFIERRLGATLSVTPHVSSAIGYKPSAGQVRARPDLPRFPDATTARVASGRRSR